MSLSVTLSATFNSLYYDPSSSTLNINLNIHSSEPRELGIFSLRLFDGQVLGPDGAVIDASPTPLTTDLSTLLADLATKIAGYSLNAYL